MTCGRCYGPLERGEHGLYKCPLMPRRAAAVRPDSIPGGILIEHGICNEDGTPKRYDSQSEINAACKARGYRRWGEYYTEDRTTAAREQMDWLKSGDAKRAMRENRDREREQTHVRQQGEQRR